MKHHKHIRYPISRLELRKFGVHIKDCDRYKQVSDMRWSMCIRAFVEGGDGRNKDGNRKDKNDNGKSQKLSLCRPGQAHRGPGC